MSGCETPEPTLYEIRQELDKIWDEVEKLKTAQYGTMSGNMFENRSATVSRTVSKHPPAEGVKLNDFKAVLQSVTSKRPFAKARQQVALSVLYISGVKVSKLLILEVRHLKTISQFVKEGRLPAVPYRAPAIAKELWNSPSLLNALASKMAALRVLRTFDILIGPGQYSSIPGKVSLYACLYPRRAYH